VTVLSEICNVNKHSTIESASGVGFGYIFIGRGTGGGIGLEGVAGKKTESYSAFRLWISFSFARKLCGGGLRAVTGGRGIFMGVMGVMGGDFFG